MSLNRQIPDDGEKLPSFECDSCPKLAPRPPLASSRR